MVVGVGQFVQGEVAAGKPSTLFRGTYAPASR